MRGTSLPANELVLFFFLTLALALVSTVLLANRALIRALSLALLVIAARLIGVTVLLFVFTAALALGSHFIHLDAVEHGEFLPSG